MLNILFQVPHTKQYVFLPLTFANFAAFSFRSPLTLHTPLVVGLVSGALPSVLASLGKRPPLVSKWQRKC